MLCNDLIAGVPLLRTNNPFERTVSMKKTLAETLEQFEQSFKGLRETARLVLAVAATTRLQRSHPLAVILVGGPSSGKTSVLMPLTKGKEGSTVKNQVLRVDDFSGASLVSHASNRTAEQLEKQDLLPKMADKCVIVKEMAPLFTGHEDDLLKKFGVFASVLDGEGYISSSGSHGRRGYEDKKLFSLLGAVTPNVLTPKVMKCLDAVGPRFCFWEVPSRAIDPSEWRGPSSMRAVQESFSTEALTEFVDSLFQEYQPNSVPMEDFHLSDDANECLSLIAFLMAALRSRGMADYDDEGNALGVNLMQESPDRAYRYLQQVAFGSALSAGRRVVNNADLVLALEIALGSASPARRKPVRALLQSTTKMTVRELSLAMKVSVDTASNYATFAERTGFVERVNFDGTVEWDLAMPFKNLRKVFHPNLVTSEEVKALQEQGSLI